MQKREGEGIIVNLARELNHRPQPCNVCLLC